ncbi:hypothetical protein ACFS6H_19980 [Terrimonas rubra]|uniref:Uncharacterized protein n=1 Tax=Terrimonas rubra TaxID=1035890 RepID=A0ABW6AC45_9BACT
MKRNYLAAAFALFITTALLASTGTFLLTLKSAHSCNWEECELRSKIRFDVDYEKDTDIYLMYLTHWNNPGWSYEQVENYMFNIK